jgi:hypothetical protein
VFNIGNFTCEDNPAQGAATAAITSLRRPRGQDTWTRPRRAAEAVRRLKIAAGDCLFAMNDLEAAWRGWQVIREPGGFGRRYRDPMFDMFAACASCLGSGTDTGLTCMACLACDGSGRAGEVS